MSGAWLVGAGTVVGLIAILNTGFRVELGSAITAVATAVLAGFGGLQIQHRNEDESRRRELARARAGYLVFFLRRQFRSWLGEEPAAHDNLLQWVEEVVKGEPGWHFDRAEDTLRGLLETAPDLDSEDSERIDTILRRFARGTNLLNVYVAELRQNRAAQHEKKVDEAEAELAACVRELEAIIPDRLLGDDHGE